MLTHLDLFSGIGGFALAAEWAGFQTIGFVEIDKYCQKVLRKHWLAVPIVEDIRDVEKIKEVVANSDAAGQPNWDREHRGEQASSREREHRTSRCSIGLDAARGEGSNSHEPVTLITGGFPCQPFSVAGKRGGKADDRYLWPAMFRVIEEVRPRWVVGENVAGIVRMELDTCLSDLERIGYTTQAFIIPACAVNAPHRRDRVWIVARHTKSNGGNQVRGVWQGQEAITRRICEDVAYAQRGQPRQSPESEGRKDTGGGSEEDVTNSHRKGLEGGEETRNPRSKGQEREEQLARLNRISEWGSVTSELGGMVNGLSYRLDGYWDREPDIPRVAIGVKHRVDRLKCLGNAIVPAVAYQILKVIAELELP